MTPHIASRFGIAGSTIAIMALAASGYAISVSYRLTPPQMALLDVAQILQGPGSVLALLFGAVALRGDKRSGRFGATALTLGTIALLLAFFTPLAHSTSRW